MITVRMFAVERRESGLHLKQDDFIGYWGPLTNSALGTPMEIKGTEPTFSRETSVLQLHLTQTSRHCFDKFHVHIVFCLSSHSHGRAATVILTSEMRLRLRELKGLASSQELVIPGDRNQTQIP